MKNDIIIYLEESLTDEDLFFGDNFCPDMVEKAASAIEGGRIYYSVPAHYRGRLESRNILPRCEGEHDGWVSIFKDEKTDNVIKILADAPFVDPSIILEMLDIHIKYQAEFTYSENVPAGLCCEIYASSIVDQMPETDKKPLPIASVVKANINQFDVELFYKAPDIRDKRLNFRCSDPRNRATMLKLFSACGKIPAYSEMRAEIEAHPEALFVAPAYYEIEITGKRNFKTICSASNIVSEARGEMSVELFSKIISSADALGFPFAISLSGAGEPTTHSSFYAILDAALKSTLLEYVVVETDASFTDAGMSSYLKGKNDPRIKFIAEVNGCDVETYKSVHGSDKFELVRQNVMMLKESLCEKSLYLQILKINETEPFLDRFYDFWEKEKMQIILMKQNTYIGKIQDRRYSDLSPLERTPCWHLQRDMFILSDGRVPFCKQDINGEHVLGDLTVSDLTAVWSARRDIFIGDYLGKRSVSPDCASCDEWYTFNN